MYVSEDLNFSVLSKSSSTAFTIVASAAHLCLPSHLNVISSPLRAGSQHYRVRFVIHSRFTKCKSDAALKLQTLYCKVLLPDVNEDRKDFSLLPSDLP